MKNGGLFYGYQKEKQFQRNQSDLYCLRPAAPWGVGNIWRFPYYAAKYGGGIFLLVYILLTVSFGYVLIMSETSIGRMTKKSPVGAFSFFGKTAPFKIGGWLNAVIPMLIVPYYSTIGGWVIKYLVAYLSGKVQVVAEDGYFQHLFQIPGRQNSGSLCFQHWYLSLFSAVSRTVLN